MLISTLTTFALRCPRCGKLQYYALSRFSLNRTNSVAYHCKCGATLINIEKKGRDNLCLQVACMMCETMHKFYYKGYQIWKSNLWVIVCPTSGVEIGYMGKRKSVLESVRKEREHIMQVADSLGCDKFFLNSGIMCQVLSVLQEKLDGGQICCECGEKLLEIEIFPDRIELKCPSCSAVGIVFAETVKDLQRARELDEVRLEMGSYRYLDYKKIEKRSPLKK